MTASSSPGTEALGTFDYVIVGGGTAGCLLANRLSADPACTVALLEAGGEDDYLWIHVPVGYLYCIGNPRTDWCFETEPEAGLNGRAIRYPRGKVLGGCSSINGMIYMRGQREDYDGWRDGDGYGANPGWGWDDVLPQFKQHEDYAGGADALHGAGGPWRVEKQRLSWKILDAFRAAAAEQGIAPRDDFNRGDNLGCGYFEVNQRRGLRWNTSRAFLGEIRARKNLAVLTLTKVTALAFDDDVRGVSADTPRCTGVVVERGGAEIRERGVIHARRQVVLAAGTVGTAQLLQLSGIGPRAQLERVGVHCRLDRPGVGGNLQDHLQLRMVFGVSGVPTLNTRAASLWGKAAMAAEFVVFRRGPLTMSPSQLGAFACSDRSVARPDLEYHVQPLSLDKFGEPLHRFPAFTASVCHLRPSSRGTIRLRSPDHHAAPVIAPNYLSTDADRVTAARALRLTRRIVASAALAPYAPRELKPGAAIGDDDAALARAASEIGTTIFHPVGTAKMGPAADPEAVVDHELRVHGVAGVTIADASVMPRITSGNTNAPTLMIAERAATLLARGR